MNRAEEKRLSPSVNATEKKKRHQKAEILEVSAGVAIESMLAPTINIIIIVIIAVTAGVKSKDTRRYDCVRHFYFGYIVISFSTNTNKF